MDAAQWARVNALLDEALSLPVSEQETFLRRECGSDQVMLDKAMALLAEHEQLTEFLETPVLQDLGLSALDHLIPEDLRDLPGYEVTGFVGGGGMGDVYAAHQVEMTRKVALKVVRAEIDSPTARRRFERELRALARLNHPAIARIYDAGYTARKRPFYAMEFVPGRSIDTAVEGLDVGARLALMTQVAEGVAHAHARSVIHRDLKPANVMMIQNSDGQSLVKIIDFGIAAFLDDSDGQTTQGGTMLGTLVYMSPEQADHGEVDVRADVYGLGCVLYQLMTDRPPHEPERLSSATMSEALQIIKEEPPHPPSKHMAMPMSREQAREVDAIVMKALAKDPEDRYQSAADFGEDVRRLREGRPVSAVPPKHFYVMGKWVRRHRWTAALTAALLLSVVIGTSVSLAGLVHARAAEKAALAAEAEASQRLAEANAALEFVDRLVLSTHPRRNPSSITMLEVLAKAETALATQNAPTPRMETTIQRALGEMHMASNRLRKARSHLDRAMTFTINDPFSEDSLRTRRFEAMLLRREGHLEEASTAFEGVLADSCSDGMRILALRGLAETRRNQGRFEEAYDLFHQALAKALDVYGVEDAETLLTMRGFALAVREVGDEHSSQAWLQWVYEAPLTQTEPSPFTSLETWLDMVNPMVERRPEEAERELKNIALITADLAGFEAIELDALHGVGYALILQQKPQEALDLLEPLSVRRMAFLGPTDYETMRTRNLTALAKQNLGQFTEAAQAYNTLLADQRMVLGETHPDTLYTLNNLGDLRIRQGEPTATVALLSPVTGSQLPASPIGLMIRCTLAEALIALERRNEARMLIEFCVQHVTDQDPLANYYRRLWTSLN